MAFDPSSRVIRSFSYGTILLTNTLTILADTTIDGSEHSIVLSGGNATRLFVVQPGVTLTLLNLGLTDGVPRGSEGASGVPGESGQGGAICNSNGVLRLFDCVFLLNRAEGGTGGGNPGPLPT